MPFHISKRYVSHSLLYIRSVSEFFLVPLSFQIPNLKYNIPLFYYVCTVLLTPYFSLYPNLLPKTSFSHFKYTWLCISLHLVLLIWHVSKNFFPLSNKNCICTNLTRAVCIRIRIRRYVICPFTYSHMKTDLVRLRFIWIVRSLRLL